MQNRPAVEQYHTDVEASTGAYWALIEVCGDVRRPKNTREHENAFYFCRPQVESTNDYLKRVGLDHFKAQLEGKSAASELSQFLKAISQKMDFAWAVRNRFTCC